MTDGEIEACISDMIALKRINNSLAKLPRCEAELKAKNLYKQTHAVCVGNCPACNVSISSWNGELIPTGASKSITAVEAETCERKRLQLLTEISNLKDLETERAKILSMYEGELDVEDQLVYLKHVKRNDAIWSACDALMREKPAEDVNELIKITQKREAITAARALVNDKIARLKRALLTLEEQNVDSLIADTRAEISALDESIEKLTAAIKLAETRKQWERVRELRAVESDMAIKLPRAVKLAALIKTAERIALEDVISNINLRAGIYLSRFFPAVTASLVFEAKSLAEKIDLKIELDGEATDINSLSGGECARLVLAFAIAMAEMNDIRTLMLDESFAALDAETTECVLEAIKENYFGKVIVIAHQTTKGLFDDVIELKRKVDSLKLL
jgi:DNA repair exonuclease SbcCD ATPase subunit